MTHPGDYQTEIYMGGLRGVKPTLPVDFANLRRRASMALPPQTLTYVEGGCGDEFTQDHNSAAFNRYGIVPRMMVDCSARDMSVALFGMHLPTPIFMSPIGVIGLCTPDGHGDIATARAAAQTGVPMVASTLMNDPMEAVAAEFGDTPGLFQLYTPKDRDLAASLVNRAEAAGFKGIVVTLDTWVTGWRPRDLNESNFPQLRGHVLANYFSDPVFRASLKVPPEEDGAAAVGAWARTFGLPLTWDDLPWLRSLTRLPLILKGICHPDDARRAIDGGADGIYCSNHGGRQANGGLAAIDMLPGVVAASGDYASAVRQRHSVGHRRGQGAGRGRGGGRHRAALCLWAGAGRHRGHRPRPALDPGGGRPADGGRRLSDDRGPAGDVSGPELRRING